MPHLVRLLVAAVAVALLTTAVSGLPAQARTWTPPSADPDADPTSDLEEFENRLLAQVNRARKRHGVRRVRVFESCVDRTSERWARHLRRTGDLAHRDQARVLRRCDLAWSGETLVRGVGLTPRSAVRAWLSSPAHRAVILSARARWAGIGARVDAEDRVIGVLNFAEPG